MSKISKHLILFLLFISSIMALLAEAKQNDVLLNENVCKSTTVRSVKDFNQLQNCTVVAGHVRLVQMQFTHDLIEQVQFSNIEEITGYLLVYRVEGLESLEILFPKLIVIRGVELLYDQYALAVLENRELQDIGLVSLLRVLKGSIRVESNPSLCFSDTINWVAILGNTTKEYTSVLKNNKPAFQCPLCSNPNENDSTNEDGHTYCWSVGKPQREALKCNKQAGATNNCLTSCSDDNCRHCINYLKDKGCIDNCLPPRYKAYERRCVSDCKSLDLITLASECIEKCPKHFRAVTKNGHVTCAINCTGDFNVHTIADLEGFSDCTTLKGSLTIELYETNKPIINHLQEAFANLNEITGYLRILRSPQLTSLNFFKNLHSIRGNNLIENIYALYVVDNYHLEKLWNTNQEVAIFHGRVYFHLNPRLCYNEIMDLQKNLKESQKITITDVSRNSNGERVICGDLILALSANVTDYNSNSAVIVHDVLDSDVLTIILGFVYYYKEAPQRNVTRYDGRHGCGQDEWFMDVIKGKLRRHILKNLKPATQYAFFVKTLTLVDYHYQYEAISEIDYFQTLPAKPGAVAKFFSHSLTTNMNEIEVFWWPPRQPNGVIEKYILKYEETNLTMATNSWSSTQKQEELCVCPKLDSYLSGATPDEEKYYQKEDVIYADALSNFIFQKNESTVLPEIDLDIPSNSTFELRYQMTLFKQQQDNIRIQDQEVEKFVIGHPLEICNQSNPQAQYQTENKCIPLETYENSTEVFPPHHTHTFTNLKADQIYRFSIRACVKDLRNGCGPEKVILAKTVTKRIVSFFESIKYYKV